MCLKTTISRPRELQGQGQSFLSSKCSQRDCGWQNECLADTPGGGTGEWAWSDVCDRCRLSSSEGADEAVLAGNMKRVTELLPVVCSIARDINFELELQTDQCARILAKVRRQVSDAMRASRTVARVDDAASTEISPHALASNKPGPGHTSRF